MLLIDRDGCVALSPSKLALLEWPSQGHWRLLQSEEPITLPSILGRAAHAVLAELVRAEWPESWFDLIPELTTRALVDECPPGFICEEQREGEALKLTELLRRFCHGWPREPGRGDCSGFPELRVRLEDRRGRLRLYGRLDLLVPPTGGEAVEVLDWKTGNGYRAREEEVQLAVVAQAALGRAGVGRRCPVTVRWVYLQTGAERRWEFDQQALVREWGRVRELAVDVLEDRWPARPGGWCEWCTTRGCEHSVTTGAAEDLGFMERIDIA